MSEVIAKESRANEKKITCSKRETDNKLAQLKAEIVELKETYQKIDEKLTKA